MDLSEVFLGQLEREVAATRRLLERVPTGKGSWRPHPKSMELGYLASLVATMPSWIAMIVDRDNLDLASGATPTGTEGLVELFDRCVADARRALSSTSDEHLMKPWQLLVRGTVVDEKPRHATIAETISHFAHHRGQLTVYLRLNDIAVPSIYGPSADEKWGGT